VSESGDQTVLVQLGAGIGNIVLSTPLLVALNELGFAVDVLLVADYAQTASLLQPWSCLRNVFTSALPGGYTHIIPALPPFYHPRFGRALACRPNTLPRPPDSLFYQNEQEFYLHFARALNYSADRHPRPSLPIAPSETCGITSGTVVLAPGCKTGVMATKRWPYFVELAAMLSNVVVVGTHNDLTQDDRTPMNFPAHVRSFVGQLSLRETAEVMASAGVVVGNDSGLSHIAAAVGTPTIMLFGPTPSKSLGPMPANVKVLRSGLPCEPCWFRNPFQACSGKIDCLAALTVDSVIQEVFSCLS
jgi:Glycosyltransferase family 9 (heptosyltransferase)